MSRFFIGRPIFASVISIIIVIAGLMASLTLPISQYPEVTPPTVIITAAYPGANAETLSKTVAAPIEEQLSGVEGLLYFNSTSTSAGTVSITVTFEVGTNPDTALIAVNNRVKVAEPRLPDDVRRTGVLVQKRSNNLLMFAALTGWLAAEVHRRRPASALALTALAALASAVTWRIDGNVLDLHRADSERAIWAIKD